MNWPDLRVTFGVGALNRGGMKTPDAVEGRQPNSPVVPEYGTRLRQPGGGVGYLGCPDQRMTFAAWEETLGGLSYVEMLYRLPDGTDPKPDASLQTGRSAMAPVKTILDLAFGPRLLGLPLLEEIGELFDDWHWNRRLDSASLATELQLRPQIVESQGFVAKAVEVIDHQQRMNEMERRRFRLASQWYWLADAEPDPVNKFLQLWLVIESLEMETSDVAPVKARLGDLLRVDGGSFVGRLYGLRSKIVHGNIAEVDPEQLQQVEVLAHVLLMARLNQEQLAAHTKQLREWVKAS